MTTKTLLQERPDMEVVSLTSYEAKIAERFGPSALIDLTATRPASLAA